MSRREPAENPQPSPTSFMPRPTRWASVTGPDRVAWLQGMVSNDVSRLAPGQGCDAAHLNARGKVVGLLRILADQDRLWIASDQDIDELVAALDRLLIMEDAEIRSCGPDWTTFAIAGPQSRMRLEQVLGESLDWANRLCDHRQIGRTRIVRSEFGYDVAVPSPQAAELAAALESAGIARGDESEWSRRSLEAGLPIYGVDVDENTILSELGGWGIDYEKGCYIGQEVVAKIRYIGHVNRHLVGLRLSGGDVGGGDVGADVRDLPGRGTALSRGGKEAGFLTRAAYSSEAGGVIAFGYVRHGNQDIGNEFLVGEGPATATVVSLPFVP